MALQTNQTPGASGPAVGWRPGMGAPNGRWGDGRWIEYRDDEQREVELGDRRAAYEREAERRALLEREHRRHEAQMEEERRAQERAERGEERVERHPGRAPRQGIDHGVRRESTSTLLRDFVAEGQYLLSQELRLARAEMKREAQKAGAAATSVGIGGFLLMLGALALATCLVALLALAMPLWLSALVVGVFFGLVGALVAMGGVSKLKALNPKPNEAAATLKEDREWASGMMRDVKSRRRAHA